MKDCYQYFLLIKINHSISNFLNATIPFSSQFWEYYLRFYSKLKIKQNKNENLNEFSQNKIQYFFSKLKFEYIFKKQNGVLLENKKTNKMAMLE